MYVPTEHEEEVVFTQWLDLHNLRFSKIAQETYTKSRWQKLKNFQEGLRTGVPDKIICTPKALLFVEMKRIKGSKIPPEQKEWCAQLNTYPGVAAIIAKGAQEAIEFVQKYL